MQESGKARLQDTTPYKVMSFQEAAKAIGWKIEMDGEYFTCHCDCGGVIEYSGFFGTEVAECTKCGKRLTNLFSPIQTGDGSAAILDFKRFELEQDENGYDRFWIAEDGKGGIKNE